MKWTKWLLAMGCFAALGGCNCTGREFSISKTFSVHSTAEDSLCQTERLEIDLMDDKGFADNKQFIGKVELRKVAVTVVNPKTDASSVAKLGNGKVRIAETADGQAIELGTYGDVPIEAGSTKDIVYDKATATTLSSLALKSPNVFFLEAEGCNDANPAFYTFKVDLTFYAEAKLF